MKTRLSILLPSCNRSTDALLSQRKMLMESRRSMKMNTPTNISNHRGVPRTKIERTISLQLIHTYSVDDQAGLRRPELGATGVERREEQPFGVIVEIGSVTARKFHPNLNFRLLYCCDVCLTCL